MTCMIIEYQDKTEESFDTTKEFSDKYFQLDKENKLSLVKIVCKVECSFKTSLSDTGIRQQLLRGIQPEEGYYIATDTYGEPHYYCFDGYTKNIKHAVKFSKKNADNQIKVMQLNPYLVHSSTLKESS